MRRSPSIERCSLPTTSRSPHVTLRPGAGRRAGREVRGEREALRQSMAIRRKRLGNEHPVVAQSLNNIGMLYVRQRQHADAEPLFKEALEINRKAVGTVHPVVGANLNNLALVYRKTPNRLPQAEEVLQAGPRTGQEDQGRNQSRPCGRVPEPRRQPPASAVCGAERYLREALAMKQKMFAADHWDVATTKNRPGRAPSDARAGTRRRSRCCFRAKPSSRRSPSCGHHRTRVATTRVVTSNQRWGKSDKAAEWRAKLPKACCSSTGEVIPGSSARHGACRPAGLAEAPRGARRRAREVSEGPRRARRSNRALVEAEAAVT